MREYDYSLLLGRMKEKGFTQAKLAEALGISETSLNLRLNNKLSFRQDEIVTASDVLMIPRHNLEQYFFASKL